MQHSKSSAQIVPTRQRLNTVNQTVSPMKSVTPTAHRNLHSMDNSKENEIFKQLEEFKQKNKSLLAAQRSSQELDRGRAMSSSPVARKSSAFDMALGY